MKMLLTLALFSLLHIDLVKGQRRLALDPQAWLDEHNKWRQVENATDMTAMVWNINLERLALRWAQKCDFSHTALAARTNKDDFRYVGENLFAIEALLDRPPSPAEVVGQSWVSDERPSFDHSANACAKDKACGHFTQVVWAETCAVGCALVQCKRIRNAPIDQNAYLAVCHYGPAGNVEGRRPFQSGPRCSADGCVCTEPQGLCHGVCQEKGRVRPANATAAAAVAKPERKGCRNQHQLCVAWAAAGKCGSDGAYMERFCRASCVPACADQRPPSYCVDKDYVLCGFLAQRGFCAGNVAVTSRCLNSCHPSCPGSLPQLLSSQSPALARTSAKTPAKSAAKTPRQPTLAQPTSRQTSLAWGAVQGAGRRGLASRAPLRAQPRSPVTSAVRAQPRSPVKSAVRAQPLLPVTSVGRSEARSPVARGLPAAALPVYRRQLSRLSSAALPRRVAPRRVALGRAAAFRPTAPTATGARGGQIWSARQAFFSAPSQQRWRN